MFVFFVSSSFCRFVFFVRKCLNVGQLQFPLLSCRSHTHQLLLDLQDVFAAHVLSPSLQVGSRKIYKNQVSGFRLSPKTQSFWAIRCPEYWEMLRLRSCLDVGHHETTRSVHCHLRLKKLVHIQIKWLNQLNILSFSCHLFKCLCMNGNVKLSNPAAATKANDFATNPSFYLFETKETGRRRRIWFWNQKLDSREVRQTWRRKKTENLFFAPCFRAEMLWLP